METEKILKKLSRRAFIRNSVLAATGATLLPSLLVSCDDKIDFKPQGEYGFYEGVASFDPSQNRVILWTRYSPASNETKPVIVLDVSTDETFTTVVVSETVAIDTASDYTVHVDVGNLQSNTQYYYRFRNPASGAISVVGQTRTLTGVGEASQVKLAVVSCSNFQAGLFNVYGAVAASNADVVVHLGDYIYEYGIGEYGTNPLTISLGRHHMPSGEIISVDDYRTRYHQYRRDEQLQKAHQFKPFICVWDDHEIANDAYKDGAENHQSNEGDFATRKANALQVWHEYLPARGSENGKIYRNFDIAGLVNLLMLDTRIIGREKQLSYAAYFTSSGLNVPAFVADWQNPSRTMLGSEQRTWLLSSLSSSTAQWQVLGSQVLMGKMFIPAELLIITAELGSNPTSELFAQYTALVTELVAIKTRLMAGDPTLKAAEKARVENVLPYNLDAWDGYPAEREAIFSAMAGKKLVTLAGDTHNAWHSKLSNSVGNEIGVEFATPSVSSPGLEAIFGTDAQTIAAFQKANEVLINDLQYLNASKRGFLLITFTAGSVQADYHYIRTIATKDITSTVEYTATET